jgi:hypothetical protein
MSALDTLSGIAIGTYCVAVAINGNSKALIDQAKKDRAFLKWAVAVGVLGYVYSMPGMAEPIALIIFIAFLGLFLQNGTKITTEATRFWATLGGTA